MPLSGSSAYDKLNASGSWDTWEVEVGQRKVQRPDGVGGRAIDVLWLGYRLGNLYWRFVTRCIYAPFFGKLGKGSTIRRPLVLRNSRDIFIGENCGIRDGARLEVLDWAGQGERPRLEIGDGSSMEQGAHIVCRQRVIIGRNVALAANCSVVDADHHYQDVEVDQSVGKHFQEGPSFVEIGDRAFLGVGVVVLPNVRIGAHCVVGANSVVTKSLPDYTVCAGAPAKVVRRYDSVKKEWVRSN